MPLKIRKKAAIKKRPAAKKKPVKKTNKRKPVKKKAAAKPVKKARISAIGIVTHYFPHVNAAVIKMKQGLTAGDRIRIKGHTTDFTQTVTSMQIDREPINTAKKGDEIGLEVVSRVRQHDIVSKA
jgi:hypothetical protein